MSSSLCRQMFSPPTPDLGLPCLNVIRIRVQGTSSETKLHNLVRIGLQPNLSLSLLFHLLPSVNHALRVHDVVIVAVCLWLVVFPECHFPSLHLLHHTAARTAPCSALVCHRMGVGTSWCKAAVGWQHTSVTHSTPSGSLPPTHCGSE